MVERGKSFAVFIFTVKKHEQNMHTKKKSLFSKAVVVCPVLTPTQRRQKQWVGLWAAHTQTSYTSVSEFGFGL